MGSTIWILGDQLGESNAALRQASKKDDCLLFIESRKRGAHLKYHKIKLVMIYSAMRHFADEMESKGWAVDYHQLENTEDFESGLRKHLKKYSPDEVCMAEPNGLFETDAVQKLAKKLKFDLKLLETEQFLVRRSDFSDWAGGKKRLLMETHYRRMRESLGLLLDDKGEPVGGKWNYDVENRKGIKEWRKDGEPSSPRAPSHPKDTITKEVISDVEKYFPEAPGNADDFWFAPHRDAARSWLGKFIDQRLCSFGEYEDLMVEGDSTLFHSALTPMLNTGLLTPNECVDAAIEAYQSGDAPLAGVEGFVRQIIGWREFINGIYWLKMPDYAESNALGAERKLPDFFYTGETEMNCLRQVIRQVIDTAYNHHIQRLMILGNFMTLAGIRPQEGLRWFLEMYADAFDWVMMANVIGMALHADGGFMATKPYVSSSSYISKMSNYCDGCRYKPSVKTGPDACPFNYLYWDFYDRHTKRFDSNPRTAMMVKSWVKRKPESKKEVLESAEKFLGTL